MICDLDIIIIFQFELFEFEYYVKWTRTCRSFASGRILRQMFLAVTFL